MPMIAPIMLLAIRESVRDMSAYVRKVVLLLEFSEFNLIFEILIEWWCGWILCQNGVGDVTH